MIVEVRLFGLSFIAGVCRDEPEEEDCGGEEVAAVGFRVQQDDEGDED